MRNRRQCIRCALTGVSMEPFAHGESVDVSETGLSWFSPEPMLPGETVTIEAPALFEALGLTVRRLPAVIRDLEDAPEGRYRIGAALVAPPPSVTAALRRAVLRLQRTGDELDSHVVDVIYTPDA